MIPSGEARAILERFRGPRVLVLGDVMLDRFVWGDVERISPEAPVPVVRVRRESIRLGGAANTAANLASLGAAASVVGVIGTDAAGVQVRESLEQHGIRSLLLDDRGRETTVKTRVIARAQQVVRVDRETETPLAAALQEHLTATTLRALSEVDAVAISDYDKGVVSRDLLRPVLAEAERRGLPVVVDPKLTHFDAYQPATVIKPNETEAARVTATHIRTDEDALAAARSILDRLRVRAVLVTRGERGMLLLGRGDEPDFIPGVAREVYDVTGAGDTVVAVMALALATGAAPRHAALLANLAAGIVVSKVGTATVTVQELAQRLRGRDRGA